MDKINIKEIKETSVKFLLELKEAEQNKTNSLAYLRHPLSSRLPLGQNERFQAISVGGTNYAEGIVLNKKEGIFFTSRTQGKSPKFSTAGDFLTFIASLADKKTTKIALNFAYPLIPCFEAGIIDGVLKNGTKENSFSGLVGKRIGKEITDYLRKFHKMDVDVSVANDTVCLFLSSWDKKQVGSFAAGVVGTGINFAIINQAEEIVNLESGNFDKFTPCKYSRIADRHTINPGQYLFEKETSGAYLHKSYNAYSRFARKRWPDMDSTEMMSRYIGINNEWSNAIAYLFKRSAAMVAAQAAGMAEYYGSDCQFAIEGSLFWNAPKYAEWVKYYGERICRHKLAFFKPKRDGLYGAARLFG